MRSSSPFAALDGRCRSASSSTRFCRTVDGSCSTGLGSRLASPAPTTLGRAYLTADDIEDDVRTTLQPETERVGDPALDFPHIARCLSALGVETSADELIKVPHSIELSERLRIRLAG